MTATHETPQFLIVEGTSELPGCFATVGFDLQAAKLRIAVKPNLTWPEHRLGVTTTPEVIGTVCKSLLASGHAVTIVESDGGYGTFDADLAFEGHGLRSLADDGVILMNLSRQTTVRRSLGGLEVDMAKPLLEDFDMIVNMPVPKVHVMTRYTGAVKNHWGTIPTDMRLRLHYRISAILADIIGILPPQLVVMDGTYFLDHTGPIEGRAVRKDLMIVANHPLIADAVALRLMGWDIQDISYLVDVAARLDFDLASIEGLPMVASERFSLKRSPWNYAALAAFRSRRLTHIGYESRLAAPLHRIKEVTERVSGKKMGGASGSGG